MQHLYSLWLLSRREYRHDSVFQRLQLILALPVCGLYLALFIFQLAGCQQASTYNPVSISAVGALLTLTHCLILVFTAGYMLLTLLRLFCSRSTRKLLYLLGYNYIDCTIYITGYWLASLVRLLLTLDILLFLLCLSGSFFPIPFTVPLLQIGLRTIVISNTVTILSAIILHVAFIAFSP